MVTLRCNNQNMNSFTCTLHVERILNHTNKNCVAQLLLARAMHGLNVLWGFWRSSQICVSFLRPCLLFTEQQLRILQNIVMNSCKYVFFFRRGLKKKSCKNLELCGRIKCGRIVDIWYLFSEIEFHPQILLNFPLFLRIFESIHRYFIF